MDTLLYTSQTPFKNIETHILHHQFAIVKFILKKLTNNDEGSFCSNFKPANRLKSIKPFGIRRFFAVAQETPWGY
jgi:hypothetical protein